MKFLKQLTVAWAVPAAALVRKLADFGIGAEPRQIVLTEVGQRLAPKVTQGFAILVDAVASARDDTSQMLHLDSTATFAQQWLTRYLGAFQLKHPNIAVRLRACRFAGCHALWPTEPIGQPAPAGRRRR